MRSREPEPSLHARLMDAVERGARAQERSHQLVESFAVIDARTRATTDALRTRREQLQAVREDPGSSQSDK
jgi:hypothetical protein